MMGVDRPMLMCRFKGKFEGKWREVMLDTSCKNFYASACNAGSRANSEYKLDFPDGRVIPVTRRRFVVVDLDDYYRLSKYRWYATVSRNTFYAARKRRGKRIFMHREIMRPGDDMVVDHIDRDGLNNCRSNLRLCTVGENCRNAVGNAGAMSKYKGVGWHKRIKKWTATIQADKKSYHIGYFSDEIDAAKAYDRRARKLHREFAYLNFPPEF
jgi:hypothetical protein